MPYFSMTEKQLLEMTRTTGGVEAAIREMPAVSLVLADGTTYDRKGKVSAVSGVADVGTGSVKMRATSTTLIKYSAPEQRDKSASR